MKLTNKGDVSDVTISIIIILVIIFIGLAIFYSKLGNFKSFLGI